MIIGIALGVLIGVLSFVPFTFLVITGHRIITDEEVSMRKLGEVIGYLLAMPTFWFGGPWVSTKVMATLDWQDLTEPYILALTVTFVLPALYLLVLLIAKTAGEMPQTSMNSFDRGRP